MDIAPVKLAKRLLSLPAGPSHQQLRRQAREYLAELTPDEYEELKQEAIADYDAANENDLYTEKLELFRKLQFTDVEAQAYAKMRIDSPGIRRVVARRALLVKFLKQPLPPGATFHEVARMEDAFLKDMTITDVLKALGVKESLTDAT